MTENQNENLFEIVPQSLLEQRREVLVQNIGEARAEFARGEVKKGTVDDLMKELSEKYCFGD